MEVLPEGVTITMVEEQPNGLICWGSSEVVPAVGSLSGEGASGRLPESFGLERHTLLRTSQGLS